MPFHGDRPEISANALASAASTAAQQFYSNGQAAAYTTPANASIQRDLTIYALELAHALAPLESTATGPVVLLDLGAGSGLSTRAASQWLDARGLDSFCIAFDISASMLLLTTTGDGDNETTETIAVLPSGRHVITSVDCGPRTAFYCGNGAQKFPLRPRSCDVAIGISMLQWLTDSGLRTCYASLVDVLHDGSAAVFQVYPTSREQVAAMESIALDMGFVDAEVVVAFPHATHGKKWFLALTKTAERDASIGRGQVCAALREKDLCPFGRRHHRRCAWHLLRGNTTSASLRERLGREHIKEAWHIWRKFHRAAALAQQVVETGTPLHVKAKRSLALWKSDEIIGEALRDRYLKAADADTGTTLVDASTGGDETKTTKITHEFLLARMDEVVQVVHAAYSKAVALEQSLVPPVTVATTANNS